MTENQIWAALLAVIHSGLTARGFAATVQQGYQPTQQGVPSTPTVTLHAIDGARYGSPRNQSRFSDNTMTQSQGYWMIRTIQVDVLSIADPRKPNKPTAFDLLAAVADILQTESAIDSLQSSGIGIIRIQALRPPFIVDDRDRNEAAPNFDFTISYFNDRSETVPSVVGYGDSSIHRV